MAVKQGMGAAARRARYGLGSVIIVLATLASCVLAGVLGSRYHLRVDVTSAGEHTLSERTLALLDRVDSPHQVIISADLTQLDRQTRSRIDDLLVEFQEASEQVGVEWIDTSRPEAPEAFRILMNDLLARDAGELDDQRAILESTSAEVRDLVTGMGETSDLLKELNLVLDPADRGEVDLERQAAVLRTIGSRLEPIATLVGESARTRIGDVELPGIDAAADAALPILEEASQAMDAISQYAELVGQREISPEAQDAVNALALVASARRDQSVRALDSLRRLEPADALIVARILAATDAVLVVSESGVLAIDFETLFPRRELLERDGGRASDVAFSGEELIATALGSLNDTRAPIAVFVHGENAELFDERDIPTPVARRLMGKALEQFRLSGINATEWTTASDPVRPSLAEFDPNRARPVVWIVLGSPSAASVDPRQAGAAAERALRVDRLGAAFESLLEDGENVLLCIEPSDLPGVGEPDPMSEALAPFGLSVASGSPLMRRESSPSGPLTYTHHIATGTDDGHAIGRAIKGLATGVSWATAVQILDAPPEGVRCEPIAEIADTDELWGESQWLALRSVVERGLARPFEPLLLSNPPAPDPQRDLTSASSGGWLIGAASERQRDNGAQRVVVVSAPSWFTDLFIRRTTEVNGRRAARFPGNLELFVSSLNWLAERDELIAPGPQVRDVPRIRDIPGDALLALRLLLVAGLPLLMLVVGAAMRVLRG